MHSHKTLQMLPERVVIPRKYILKGGLGATQTFVLQISSKANATLNCPFTCTFNYAYIPHFLFFFNEMAWWSSKHWSSLRNGRVFPLGLYPCAATQGTHIQLHSLKTSSNGSCTLPSPVLTAVCIFWFSKNTKAHSLKLPCPQP